MSKSKAGLYKGLSIFAYTFSGITTLIFLVSFGITIIDKLLGIVITALFEPSKPPLFMQIFKKHKDFIKAIIIVSWLIIEVASITASTSYMMNMNNKSIQLSPAYVSMKQKEENLKSLIDADKKALELSTNNLSDATKSDSQKQLDNTKLVDSYNANIKILQDKLNKQNNELQYAILQNMPQTISKLKEEVKSLNNQIANTEKARDNLKNGNSVADVKEIINNLNSSIFRNTKELNSIDYNSIKAEKVTSGYLSVFIPLGKLINVDAEILALIFCFVVFGVTPELLGNLFYYLYQKELETPDTTTLQKEAKKGNNYNNSQQMNYKPSQDLVTAQAQDYYNNSNNMAVGSHSFIPNENLKDAILNHKVIQGFQFEPIPSPANISDGYTKDDVIEYLTFMYANIKPNNISVGQNDFKNGTGLTWNQIKGIRFLLGKLKIIEVQGQNTKILVSNMADAIKLI